MLLQCNFNSWALGHATNVIVILPSDAGAIFTRSHRSEGKYPVLYLLHGGFDDGSSWQRQTAIERYATERRVAVVLPTCENKCYRQVKLSFPGMAWEADKTEDYEAFLAQELPDWLSANFPISTDPAHSYIAGLSMGGYGAAFHAFTRPQDYAAVGLFSPYLFNGRMFDAALRQSMTEDQLVEELIPDLVEPVKAIAAAGGRFPKVFMMNGTKDVQEFSPLYARLLRESGAEVTSDFTTYAYGHEWPFWDICAKQFLDWIPRTDDYAGFAPAQA